MTSALALSPLGVSTSLASKSLVASVFKTVLVSSVKLTLAAAPEKNERKICGVSLVYAYIYYEM
jgi:hypothetical protein